jgi:hypothetical protein
LLLNAPTYYNGHLAACLAFPCSFRFNVRALNLRVKVAKIEKSREQKRSLNYLHVCFLGSKKPWVCGMCCRKHTRTFRLLDHRNSTCSNKYKHSDLIFFRRACWVDGIYYPIYQVQTCWNEENYCTLAGIWLTTPVLRRYCHMFVVAWLTVTGSGLDDLIYWHLLVQSLLITINLQPNPSSLIGEGSLHLVLILRLTAHLEFRVIWSRGGSYEKHRLSTIRRGRL